LWYNQDMSPIQKLDTPRLELPYEAIAEFCGRWRIVRLELFGSALHDDFKPDSDLDFLVSFAPDAAWSLLDLVRAEEELSGIVGRAVDLAEREPIEQSHNWVRRKAILESARTLYVA
jgi:predicted nucleotidyltransferase